MGAEDDPLPAELVTGNTLVDEQHRAILAALKSLWETRDIDAAVQSLSEHFSAHFACEETLMEAAGYPDEPQHRMAHLEFFDIWLNARARWQRIHDNREAADFMAAMAGWLKTHVLGEDMRMARWLKGER